MRVRPGAWEIITDKLSSFGASLANYKKIGATWLTQFLSGVDPAHICLSRNRKGKFGSPTKLTSETVLAIIELQAKYKGGLSRRRMAGKLAEEKGIKVSEATMRNWLKAMNIRRLKRYLKPKLTRLHKIKRLTHVLDEFAPGPDGRPQLFPFHEVLGEPFYMFSDLTDVVHVDEKWFYLMHDGTIVRMFPNPDGS